MAEIARRIDVPHATIRNYFAGRLPAPEVLIKIARATNISLNWLLMGAGEMYAGPPKQIDLDRLLEERIGEVHGRQISVRGRTLYPLYHPAAALRSTKLRETLFADARGLRALLTR